MSILIKNGRVIDPANNIDHIRDILIENSKITKVVKDMPVKADEIIDAVGKIVMPGIVDIHVHLREPGREDKETIATGTSAALKGGVTSVLTIPNTQPVIDCVESVKLLQDIVKKASNVNVFIAAAITKGRKGQEITDIVKLKNEGVLVITDDGLSVDREDLLLQALQKAKENNVLVMCHSEDRLLSAGGVVNLGIISTRMGLRGISNESEYKRVARDIQLAEKISAPVHIAHVSCQESIEIIAQAKKKGIRITADTAPHYFSLTEEQVLGYDTNMKINPPLRSKGDKEAIRQGLKNSIIDAIASDHAPHTENEKDIEFEHAEFGTIGLETELAVGITELVAAGILDWTGLVKKMSTNPAEIIAVDKGTLSAGKDADVIVVDPQKEWTVKKDDFLSKSKNSVFLGRRLRGVVEYTICNGKVVYKVQAD